MITSSRPNYGTNKRQIEYTLFPSDSPGQRARGRVNTRGVEEGRTRELEAGARAREIKLKS